MIITREEVVARIEVLNERRIQKIGELNAIIGALQDCEFWLNEFDKPKELKPC